MGDIDKIGVALAGRPLLAHVCEAVADAGTLVVVGPARLEGTPKGAVVVREDPPFSGPAAALGAGLAALATEPGTPVVVLAGDVPRARDAVPLLLAAFAGDGVVARSSDGFRQPLVAVYRAAALASALSSYPSLVDRGVNQVTRTLDLVELALPDEILVDVDTPADLQRLKDRYDD